jgi:hypothetical protein
MTTIGRVTEPDAPPARTPDDPRQGPLVVAVLGAIVVALLLFLPIRATTPDPYWTRSLDCGNAFSVSDEDWHDPRSDWWDADGVACGNKRGDRLGQIAATVTATLLVATFVLALPRRRRSEAEAAEVGSPAQE